MAVLRPLKLVLTNIPEGEFIETQAVNNPEDESAGTRTLQISRDVFIECDDFIEDPPKKYFRLKPGGDVRLKYAFIITCNEVIKNDAGEIVELRCTADLDSKAGGPNAGRKVNGTIHWVSAALAVDAEVRLCDRLFKVAEPDADGDFMAHVNHDSLESVSAKLEPELASLPIGETCQFERLGYFTPDSGDSSPEKLVFNRTITLRDTWAKMSGE
jgi:glutaminyl-tRNA synthetase